MVVMLVMVRSQSLKITKALRRFTQKQAQKLQKLHQRISKIQVSLDKRVRRSKDDSSTIVKYIVSLPDKTVVLSHKANDMYQAVVDATQKVLRQVRKLKEERLTKTRNSPHSR